MSAACSKFVFLFCVLSDLSTLCVHIPVSAKMCQFFELVAILQVTQLADLLRREVVISTRSCWSRREGGRGWAAKDHLFPWHNFAGLLCFHLELSQHLMIQMSWMSACVRKLNKPTHCWVRLGKDRFGPSWSRWEVNLERGQLLILTMSGNCTAQNWPVLNLRVLHGVFLRAPYPLCYWGWMEIKELCRQRNHVTYLMVLMIQRPF